MSTALLEVTRARPSARRQPWRAVLAAADRKRRAFERVLLKAFRQAQLQVDVVALERAVRDRSEPQALMAVNRAYGVMAIYLRAELPQLMLDTLVAGGTAAWEQRTARGFRLARTEDVIRFDLVNPESVRWSYLHAGELIADLLEDTREAFLYALREIIAESYSVGYPVAAAARQIAELLREHVGLTGTYAQAVRRLEIELLTHPGGKVWAGKIAIRVPKNGIGWELLARRALAYARRLLNWRAKVIARTETIRAANEGQLELWRRATEAGLLRGDEWKVWIVTPDDRLCDECEQLEGEEVPMDAQFSSGDSAPPLHPLCRCTIGLTSGPTVREEVHP